MGTKTEFGEVRAVSVGELFNTGADQYSIPLYQRNYTWGEEQIHRLLHDILDEAEHPDRNDYFLGNLVVAPPESSTHADPFDVIDGQQRLTTLYILLRVLRTYTEFADLIDDLQPLTYDAREKATRALRGVTDAQTDGDTKESSEDSGILKAGEIIRQLLGEPVFARRFLTRPVIAYLLHNVLLVRMPIDRTTDLNRYFEIMNTRGAQLSPVDIVKARLLRNLVDPLDRALLNLVWTSCSDMYNYVAMTVTAGDTQLRSVVFGSEWDAVPSADFDTLRALLIGTDAEHGESLTQSPIPTKSTAMTLDEAVQKYALAGPVVESHDAEQNERFTSQITFPTFLLHVLEVRRTEDKRQQDDRELDDKQLVRRFDNAVEKLPANSRANWVRNFTTDLLRIRFLFDRYILKRDAIAPSDDESSSNTEPGGWSLARLARGESRRGGHGKIQYSPRYPATFSSDVSDTGARSLQRKILLLQSALRITYTSPRTMHWMTDLLRYVTACADHGDEVTARGFLRRLNTFALDRLNTAINPNPTKEEVGPDGFPLGFGIHRIVFTYLDYLLVEHLQEWDFTFSYRTSIEHFSPVTEDTDHTAPEYRVRDCELLNYFGNLALVTVSANSKFSNLPPGVKANNPARRQSLKLELMARRAKAGRWNQEDITAHHREMIGLLRAAVSEQ